MNGAWAVELDRVTKDYVTGWRGKRWRALDAVSLTIPRGQVFGLLGPNGSGKSTCIKIMLGLTAPTCGRCRRAGGPAGSVEGGGTVGYLPEEATFYPHLSGRELMLFYARTSGVPPALRADRVQTVLAWVKLSDAAERRVGTYSKGMLRRIGLAQALVHDPELVILDEPMEGLDPVGVVEVVRLIRALKAAGKTVIVTSHLLSEMETLCDRVALLHRGRIMVEGAVDDLLARSDSPSDSPAFHLEPFDTGLLGELERWVEDRGYNLRRVVVPGADLHALFLAKIDRAGGQPASEERPR